jgi:hypothetical protein
MSARLLVHELVRDLYRDKSLLEKFQSDPAAVLKKRSFSEDEYQALFDGSFPALHRLGMHPLAQMVYSLARHPAVADRLSVRGYIESL